MIKMQVIGNLGKDCVVNTVNGKNVINFTVAHTEKYKDSQGNNQEKTTWVDCAYWTDRTAIAPYLQKGTQVFVEGTPEVRSFQRNDGTAGASLSLRVRDVQLLGRKGDNTNPGGNSAADQGSLQGRQGTPAPAGVDDVADDLPF
jgi:single-strand DNA-binding protein